MKKLLAVGVIVLFLGLAIAPSINANIGELSVDNILDENDTLQLESELQRIRTYLEMQPEEDCGCDDANTTEWDFPVICTLLYPLLISFALLRIFEIEQPYIIMVTIGVALNCFWI